MVLYFIFAKEHDDIHARISSWIVGEREAYPFLSSRARLKKIKEEYALLWVFCKCVQWCHQEQAEETLKKKDPAKANQPARLKLDFRSRP